MPAVDISFANETSARLVETYELDYVSYPLCVRVREYESTNVRNVREYGSTNVREYTQTLLRCEPRTAGVPRRTVVGGRVT